MKPEPQIRATYADVLEVADPAILRVIGDLDALYASAPIPATPPFNTLLATRARATSRPGADDSPETAISGLAGGGAPPRSRHGWLRQGLAFAGAALAFALVATVLVLLFRDSDESSTPGAQPEASPTATAEAAQPAATATQPIVAGSNPDQIAFTSIQDGNPEIYLINADGSGLTRLTDDPAADREPTWSPDGAQIAFASDRDGEQRLYVMNAGGSETRLVTDEANGVAAPVWSPDGEWIAFVASTENGFLDIFIVHPDGTDLRRLTDWHGIDTDPVWSPTSQQVVYRSDSGPGAMDDVFLVNIDGSGRANLTEDVIPQREPQWSPDGTRIAFSHTSRAVEMDQGYVGYYDTIAFYDTTQSGSNPPLRTTELLGSAPRWSPDGRYLAYYRPAVEPGTSGSSGSTVHILQADGLETGRIPGLEGTTPGYDWSPDGSALAVAVTDVGPDGSPGDNRSLWLAQLDGSAPVLLAEQLDSWSRPAWRPDPSRTPEPSTTTPDLAVPTVTPDTREPSESVTPNTLDAMAPLQPGQERHFVFDIRADYRSDESSFLAWNVKGSQRMLQDGTLQTYMIARDADYNVLIEYVDDGERSWLDQRGWIETVRVQLPSELGLGLLEPGLAAGRMNFGAEDLLDERTEGDVHIARYTADSSDRIDEQLGVEIGSIHYEIRSTGDPVQVARTRQVVTATDGTEYTLFDIAFESVIVTPAQDDPGNYVVPDGPGDDALRYTPPAELPNGFTLERHWRANPGREQMTITGPSGLNIELLISPSRGGLDTRQMQTRAERIGTTSASGFMAGGDIAWLYDETGSWPTRAVWDNGRYRIEFSIGNVTSREQWNEDDLVVLIYALAGEELE